MTGLAARITSAGEFELESPEVWTIKQLNAYVGGLSNPSKMPGYAYSLPAAECNVGTRLRAAEGSTCQHCYAFERGRYAFPTVQSALYRRLESITKPYWAQAMAELINRRAERVPYFRWHDSGDIQSSDHLERIVRVCELTAAVKHWMPTRENRLVLEYLKREGAFPANLNVRMSAHMIGGTVPTFRGTALTVSTVSRGDQPPDGAHRCPAPKQGNACAECRACWDPSVPIVDYHLH